MRARERRPTAASVSCSSCSSPSSRSRSPAPSGSRPYARRASASSRPASSTDGRRCRRARDDPRPHGRPAGDRRGGDDGLRQPEGGAERRRRWPSPPRQTLGVDAERALPAAARQHEGLRLRQAQGRPGGCEGARAARASPASASYPEERRVLPAGRGGGAGARLCGNRQPRARRASSCSSSASSPGARGARRSSGTRSAASLDVVRSVPERPGKDVFLTLDHTIQANVESVLRSTVSQWGAKRATRGRARSADRRHPRDGRRAGLRREPIPDGRRRTSTATSPSRTRTSPARHSSSSASSAALVRGSRRADDAVHAAREHSGRRPRRSTTRSRAAPRR